MKFTNPKGLTGRFVLCLIILSWLSRINKLERDFLYWQSVCPMRNHLLAGIVSKAYFAYITKLKFDFPSSFLTAAILAQAVERWTAMWDVVGSIPVAEPILKFLK